MQDCGRFSLKSLLGAISFNLTLLISLLLISSFNPIFYHLLILLNCLVLLICIIFYILCLEILHATIVSPWSFIPTNFWSITSCFSSCLALSLELLLTFCGRSFLCIMITESLFKHLFTNMCLFNVPGQMIVLFIHHIFSVKSICNLCYFFNL